MTRPIVRDRAAAAVALIKETPPMGQPEVAFQPTGPM